MEKKEKQPYEAPELTVHGNVETITLGSGSGYADCVLGQGIPGNPGLGPDQDPTHDSCS